MRLSHYWLTGLVLALAPALASADIVVQAGAKLYNDGDTYTGVDILDSTTVSDLSGGTVTASANTGSYVGFNGTQSTASAEIITGVYPLSESVQFKMTTNVRSADPAQNRYAQSMVAWDDTLVIGPSQANKTVLMEFTITGDVTISETVGSASWELLRFDTINGSTLAGDGTLNGSPAPTTVVFHGTNGIHTISTTVTKAVTLDGSGQGDFDLQFTSESIAAGLGGIGAVSADLSSTIVLTGISVQGSGDPIPSALFSQSGLVFAVPEPGSFLLLAAIGGVGGVIRRRRPAIV